MKTVLVTGASSGIGKVIARRMVAEGYRVYAAARRTERMEDLKEIGVRTLKMDITKEDEVTQVVERIAEESGGVDILVNNAGFGLYGAMEDTELNDARYQFEVNLFGLARLTQLVLPAMREKGWGKVVNISSMAGKVYMPLGSWYHATKHALEGWSDSLRLEVASFGIDVIVLEPGLIQTEFGDVMVEPMLARSGASAYGDLAKRLAEATKASYSDGSGSSPTVIADLVLKSVKARRPRTRYVAGRLAKPLIWVRRWFGDRIFDRVIMSQV